MRLARAILLSVFDQRKMSQKKMFFLNALRLWTDICCTRFNHMEEVACSVANVIEAVLVVWWRGRSKLANC